MDEEEKLAILVLIQRLETFILSYGAERSHPVCPSKHQICIAGKSLSNDQLRRILEQAGGDIERASNAILDQNIAPPVNSKIEEPEIPPGLYLLGSISLSATSTTSGTGVVSHGESLQLRFPKPGKGPTRSASFGRKRSPARSNITRLIKQNGSEVGSLPPQARYVCGIPTLLSPKQITYMYTYAYKYRWVCLRGLQMSDQTIRWRICKLYCHCE